MREVGSDADNTTLRVDGHRVLVPLGRPISGGGVSLELAEGAFMTARGAAASEAQTVPRGCRKQPLQRRVRSLGLQESSRLFGTF